MKLSSESITNAFNLRVSKELVIQCIVSQHKIKDIAKAIRIYNNNLKIISEISKKDKINIDGLLINLEDLNSENFIDIETYLISIKGIKEIVLDLSGVDKSKENRDFILSLINRYDIHIIKGTKDEIFSLISREKCCGNLAKDKFRDFSRKNNTILIIEDNNYWITDGYSEFTINVKENLLADKKLKDILTGLIMLTTACCDIKEKRVEAILLAINIFEISKNIILEKTEISEFEDNIKSSLIQEIVSLDIEDICRLSNIGYKFKR